MKAKINLSKNRAITTAITVFLMLTIAVPYLTQLPTVSADNINVNTYLFLVATPNPVGKDQPISVTMMDARVPSQFPNGTSVLWRNWVLTTTDPDGITQNTTYTSDWVGAWNTQVVPDKVGNWTFQFSFPGQIGEATYAGKYFLPATSAKVVVTVQEEAIAYYPENPLPTDYWTRPINAENPYWSSIAGNWLCKGYDVTSLDANFNPYTTAPNSAHIVWTKDVALGGVAGGFSAETYNPLWLNPLGNVIIIQGRIYYSYNGGLECRDIRTGEEIWWQNGTSVTFGQVLQFNSAQGMGDYAYLWSAGTTWKMYDAYTGNWILNMANATSVGGMFSPTAFTFGPNGEILVYLVGGTTPNRWLAMWNSSAVERMMTAAYGVQIAQVWSWSPPQGATLDWRTGIQWNKTLDVTSGTPSISKLDPKQPDAFYSRQSFSQPDMTVICQDMAISLKPGEEGRVLWGPTNRTAKPSVTSLDIGSGVFVEYVKETGTCNGYDVYTGEQLWSNEEIHTTDYSVYNQMSINAGYGKEYFGTYEGITYCMDLRNGSLLWKFSSGNSGLQTPYGTWPFYGGTTLADHKLYAVTGEHTPQNPIWKGEKMFCIDVNTGENVWNITGLWVNPAIADGYALAVNAEDNRLYSFGKGQTDTTVQAPMTEITAGSNVIIQGSVTDQSPGSKGTPAISDNDMTPWMQYIYFQQPKPSSATGVPVTLDAIDPNGNFVHVGDATSDMSGFYSCTWAPPDVPGKYTIIAKFAGSESYYGSLAETAVVIGSPAATTGPTATPPIMDTINASIMTNTLVAAVAIIIAIAIVGILVLRKKP